MDAAVARPIYLDVGLARAYLTWSRDVEGNSPKWVHKQKSYLAWWEVGLQGVDLRRARLVEDIERALGPDLKPGDTGYSTRAKRIAVIKGLYSYMRSERHARDAGFGIRVEEDPVFGSLQVPQSDVATGLFEIHFHRNHRGPGLMG